MTAQAQENLRTLLAEQGVRLVNTPTMCEILLKQKFAQEPETIAALLGVYRLGRVEVLLALGEGEREHLAQQAVRQHGLSPEAARWAVAAWTHALEQTVHAHNADVPMLEPPVDPQSVEQPFRAPLPHTFIHSLLVMLAGALGGLIPGVYDAFHLEERLQHPRQGKRYVRLPYRDDPVLFGLINGLAGVFGGAGGAALGWLLGGRRNRYYVILGDLPWDILLSAIIGTGLCAYFGAHFGLLAEGPPGVLLGSFTGALLGGLLGDMQGRFRHRSGRMH